MPETLLEVEDLKIHFPTQDGLARSAFVPWQYIARRPHVNPVDHDYR